MHMLPWTITDFDNNQLLHYLICCSAHKFHLYKSIVRLVVLKFRLFHWSIFTLVQIHFECSIRVCSHLVAVLLESIDLWYWQYA